MIDAAAAAEGYGEGQEVNMRGVGAQSLAPRRCQKGYAVRESRQVHVRVKDFT